MHGLSTTEICLLRSGNIHSPPLLSVPPRTDGVDWGVPSMQYWRSEGVEMVGDSVRKKMEKRYAEASQQNEDDGK